jgi:hypothetical protein
LALEFVRYKDSKNLVKRTVSVEYLDRVLEGSGLILPVTCVAFCFFCCLSGEGGMKVPDGWGCIETFASLFFEMLVIRSSHVVET